MKIYHLKGLLQATGWVKNVSIKLSSEGLIQEISQYDPTDKTIKIIDGYALPGFQNAHSHAFQYAMAGLAERHHHNGHQDDFWGWREAMYQLALGVDPDQMQSIATMLYSEMVRHGYTNVAEFHYVHHDPNGRPYNNLAEMGSRLIAAAETAGIGITLIPIFYQKGGFGQEPNDRQRRFISVALDDYLKLWEASKEACKCYKHATIGVGIHSMRGVEPAIIEEISKSGPQDVPFHIHVSEQLKEVEESLQYLGKRPVEWLLDHVDLNERFHLVHATHLTDKETEGIASSKANVVLCPSTEGNLGDGLFPLRNYQKNGGKWSIGTDSHIGLNPFEELRILDYGQRLTSHKRDSYTSEEQADSGMHAITMATTTGRRAMGNPNSKFFEVGQPLNAAIINASSPIIGATSEANLTSTMVYASDASMQLDTISHGKMVHNNQNQGDRQQIIQKFNTAIMALNNR